MEKQREEILKEKDELEKKYAEAEEALEEVPYVLRLHLGISSQDWLEEHNGIEGIYNVKSLHDII